MQAIQNMIPEPRRRQIVQKLKEIEQEHQVKILFACESGSRAWGFPSQDSDFDVRFIYLHPHNWYLSVDLEKKRDVIDYPIDDLLDINGWDLRKALQLLYKSNMPLMEWLGSPVIYTQEQILLSQLKILRSDYYQENAAFYHYVHLARKSMENTFEQEQICLKKYFYILRPLLSLDWIDQKRGLVPTEFHILLDTLIPDQDLKNKILKMIEDKSHSSEKDTITHHPEISQLIKTRVEKYKNIELKPSKKSALIEPLNQFFQTALNALWTR